MSGREYYRVGNEDGEFQARCSGISAKNPGGSSESSCRCTGGNGSME